MPPASRPSNLTPKLHHEYFTACFRSPGARTLGNPGLEDEVRQVAEDPNFSIAGLSTGTVEALGFLAPHLLCGEESAVHVFFRESRRSRKAQLAARTLLWQVAGEEKVHEAMVSRLASMLPVAGGLAATRQRGHDYFIGLASADPAVHFARVAALDSGVCKIMAALCASPAIVGCPTVQTMFVKIRSDEARHVRISRKYVADLGLSCQVLKGATEQVCPGLVTFLWPAGEAFEKLGIDSDRLFRHVKEEV